MSFSEYDDIVVFDKMSYQISEELFDDVSEYIDENYVALKSDKVLYRGGVCAKILKK